MTPRSVATIDEQLVKISESRNRARVSLDAVLRAPEVDTGEVYRYEAWIARCDKTIEDLLDERGLAKIVQW